MDTQPNKQQSILDNKIVALGALSIVAALLVVANTQTAAIPMAQEEAQSTSAQEYVLQAYNMMRSGHAIDDARNLNEQALAIDPQNEGALYSLARIYYILGEHDKSLQAIAAYKANHPEKKRIHYIAGLSNAYAGNLAQAQNEFEAFIDSGLATWPGHLDLAWVHFQQGNFSEAEAVLTNAVEVFGGNAWLNTSLGGVYVAQGEYEKAEAVLATAKVQAAAITPEDWHANFSFNNPAQAEQEIAQMTEVIDFNLALATGEEVAETPETLGIPFADPSPQGFASGVVVSACGDACPHTTCTPTNSCGDSNGTGEYITCLGTCSISAPAERPGYGNSCTATNACGASNVGTLTVCTGSGVACSVSAPANPDGYGDACTVTNACGSGTGTIQCDGSCSASAPSCPPPEGNITASPSLIQPGQTTSISWSTDYTLECTVTAPNGDSWTGSDGTQTTSPILEPTTYSLSCDDAALTDSVTVQLVPAWEEF